MFEVSTAAGNKVIGFEEDPYVLVTKGTGTTPFNIQQMPESVYDKALIFVRQTSHQTSVYISAYKANGTGTNKRCRVVSEHPYAERATKYLSCMIGSYPNWYSLDYKYYDHTLVEKDPTPVTFRYAVYLPQSIAEAHVGTFGPLEKYVSGSPLFQALEEDGRVRFDSRRIYLKVSTILSPGASWNLSLSDFKYHYRSVASPSYKSISCSYPPVSHNQPSYMFIYRNPIYNSTIPTVPNFSPYICVSGFTISGYQAFPIGHTGSGDIYKWRKYSTSIGFRHNDTSIRLHGMLPIIKTSETFNGSSPTYGYWDSWSPRHHTMMVVIAAVPKFLET